MLSNTNGISTVWGERMCPPPSGVSQSRPPSRSQLADVTPGHHSLFHECTVFFKDTSGRIHLALARAFLVRWMFALAIGDLLFAGLRIGCVMIAPLVLCGAARPQSMPKENVTGSASRIEVKDETGRIIRTW